MSGPTASTGSASSYEAATEILAERDPVLGRLIAEAGPFQVDPPTETHFAALVRAITYQQLAGAAARAIHGRCLADARGGPGNQGTEPLEISLVVHLSSFRSTDLPCRGQASRSSSSPARPRPLSR